MGACEARPVGSKPLARISVANRGHEEANPEGQHEDVQHGISPDLPACKRQPAARRKKRIAPDQFDMIQHERRLFGSTQVPFAA